MDKKIMGIIVGVIIIIAASLFYVFYIADYTYSDERMSITVPAGTNFNITAKDAGGDFSSVIYNDSSKKNIVIKMIKVPETSLFGVTMKDYTLRLQETSLKNDSYTSVQVTDNYTIYYNNKTGRYNALIKNPGFNGYVLIGCNGNLEDIIKLAESFKFKSFTTQGLTIEHVNSTSNTTTNSNTTLNSTNTTNNNQTTTKSSENDYIYLDEGESAPYHDGWEKQDYIDHGYRSTDPNAVG